MAKHNRNQNATPAQTAAQPVGAAQQVPATTARAAPVNAAMHVIYKVGKPYNVRPGTQQDNARSWAKVQECLNANNGQATREQLTAAVTPFNHAPFVAYAIRRGWLTTAA